MRRAASLAQRPYALSSSAAAAGGDVPVPPDSAVIKAADVARVESVWVEKVQGSEGGPVRSRDESCSRDAQGMKLAQGGGC
ncbi:hypothetical protein L1987_49223 [Smallanthus sonchifolius]|uniref:Uncharacterized protein n=1 Tax=Smallanthus sonchifolius TaxID=185202 RepID=A0ACB9FU41_9ASTR|nr:hypothetical protein L1987_49223 [Smallanthus sonchifolius]